MEIREATVEDIDGIRETARLSLSASYADLIDDEVIEEAIETWYGDEFVYDLGAGRIVVLVAAEEGTVRGFAQGDLVEGQETIGEIEWLHVHPDERRSGVGARLLHRTETTLAVKGAERLRGRVLADNEVGEAFYREQGYRVASTREIEIGDGRYEEVTMVKTPDAVEEIAAGSLEPRPLPSGETGYVAYDEGESASAAPLYVTYLDENREEPYGWLCGACGSFDVAMDPMGRAECTACGNRRKATRWDASYL
ncbi:MAG: GNAT family N-acetyltransferase [Haloferacaceae archaeon]